MTHNNRNPSHDVVLMLGTSLETKGGVSAVAHLLSQSRLFDDWNVIYIATHCDGSRGSKLRIAVRSWLQFMRWLASSRVCLVHVHLASYASFWRKVCFIVPSFIAGVPVVVHVHGAKFIEFYSRLPALGQSFVRRILRRCVRVIALSEQWERRLAALLTINHVAHNVVVVPNPVVVPPMHNPVFRRRDTVLFLGHIGQRKGCYVLLDALQALARTRPNIRLLAGGDGDHAAFLREAATRGLSSNVQLLGWVTGASKRRLLARASVFVLPSYSEGLPMALLEAMAAGMPVVTTPVGGIVDLVRNGIDGLLVAPGDAEALAAALDRLLGDDALRDTLGRSARERVANHCSVDEVVGRIGAVYSDVVASRTSAPRSAALAR